ncbi:MAG: acetyl-CoA hydrolase [Xanthomonadales bacterium]|nr:acetyl-CoA hydrolase [Xanthomonadales bacterium]
MVKAMPVLSTNSDEFVQFVRQRLGNHWIVGAPLALGKPNHLVNALYLAARADASIRLELFTALSLNPPKLSTGLKQRFLGPFIKRQFGDYPRLEYLQDLDRGTVPNNISISEFYFRSGSRLHDRHAQRHYVSSNYTHVARDMQTRGVNLLVQMVAVDPQRPGYYSLASNPDVTLDLRRRIPRENLLFVGQINAELPYMGGDAELAAAEFDWLLDGHPQPLFAVPRMAVSTQDFLVGLHASQLVRDGGTLQLGIGSLGDAVSFFTVMRHKDNRQYRDMLKAARADARCAPKLRDSWGGDQAFERGLYAASEMFMEGFLHLRAAGVLKRNVYDHCSLQQLLNQGLINEDLAPDSLDTLWTHGALPARLAEHSLAWLLRFGILQPGTACNARSISTAHGGSTTNDLSDPGVRSFLTQHALGKKLTGGVVLHAAFFLGSQWMYDTLNGMSRDERSRFHMTDVARINQLYGGEELDRAQRLEGRFINTAMKMTLLGAAVSDQLSDGQVVSGVGGQYNFVAMAHALERGRSVLMLRSCRGSGRKAASNIVWEYPHTTIPRHLRDIVVTEYGVADLRGAQDEEVIQRLICIADNRWQEELRAAAVKAGKLDTAWTVPAQFRNNSPRWMEQCLSAFRRSGALPDYPFGSDFTSEEQLLARALTYLASLGDTRMHRLILLLRAVVLPGWPPRGRRGAPAGSDQDIMLRACISRMGLENPGSWREKLERRLLELALVSCHASTAP